MYPIYREYFKNKPEYLTKVIFTYNDDKLVRYLIKKYGLKTICCDVDGEITPEWEDGWKNFIKNKYKYLSSSTIAVIGFFIAANDPNKDVFDFNITADLLAKGYKRLALYMLLEKFRFNDDNEAITDKLFYLTNKYQDNDKLMPIIHSLYLHYYKKEKFNQSFSTAIKHNLTLEKLAGLEDESKLTDKMLAFYCLKHMDYYSEIISKEVTEVQLEKFFQPIYQIVTKEEDLSIFDEIKLNIKAKNIEENDFESQRIKMIISEFADCKSENFYCNKLWVPWNVAYHLTNHALLSMSLQEINKAPQRIYEDVKQVKNWLFANPYIIIPFTISLAAITPISTTVMTTGALLFIADAYRGNPNIYFAAEQLHEDIANFSNLLVDKLVSNVKAIIK
jgi:hypothetical protein